jgi:hypothetical protein
VLIVESKKSVVRSPFLSQWDLTRHVISSLVIVQVNVWEQCVFDLTNIILQDMLYAQTLSDLEFLLTEKINFCNWQVRIDDICITYRSIRQLYIIISLGQSIK